MIKKLRFKASESSGEVAAILNKPKNAASLLVLSHGAGAGMEHPFMEKVTVLLAENSIATFRFNFPYMEKGRRSPDPPAIAQAAIVSAVQKAVELAEGLPVLAGGKSFGGRMTSLAAARGLLPEVKGLVFFGFPLHAMGKPSLERAEHLDKIKIPMLFLQGTKDKLADIDLIVSLVKRLGKRTTLFKVESADHSFHVPKSSGKNDEDVLTEICNKVKSWEAAINPFS